MERSFFNDRDERGFTELFKYLPRTVSWRERCIDAANVLLHTHTHTRAHSVVLVIFDRHHSIPPRGEVLYMT